MKDSLRLPLLVVVLTSAFIADASESTGASARPRVIVTSDGEIDDEFQLRALGGVALKSWWFNPRTGEATAAGTQVGAGAATFDPPGSPAPGNDWVLVLDAVTKNFNAPGAL